MTINLPYIDRIWRTRGTLEVSENLAPDEAFARLDPLFQTPGTRYEVDGDTLTYAKRNPAAQDKLATFTRGRLQVSQGAGGTRLTYDLSSTALILTFLAPLLFLAFAQLAVALNAWEAESTEAAAEAKEKDKGKDKDDDEAKKKRELHWIDQMLGAPEPKKPDEDKKKGEEEQEGKHKPTPAYVLAGIFAAIWLVGRFLEPWLVRRTFRRALAGEAETAMPGHGGGGLSPAGAATGTPAARPEL